MQDLNLISITVDEYPLIAESLLESQIPHLIIGNSGIGKTTQVHNLGAKIGAKVIDIRLADRQPEDVRGLCSIENGATIMTRPLDMPPSDCDGKYIIFLDEILVAMDDTRKAAFQLFRERKIGNYSLPKNSYVIAAGNSGADGTKIYHLDRATADSFVILHLINDTQNWIKWAQTADIHPDIVSFIQENEAYLDQAPHSYDLAHDSENLLIVPSPRSWEHASILYTELKGKNAPQHLVTAVLSGKLGQATAQEFEQFIKQRENIMDIQALLNLPSSEQQEQLPSSIEQMSAFMPKLYHHLKDESTFENSIMLLSKAPFISFHKDAVSVRLTINNIITRGRAVGISMMTMTDVLDKYDLTKHYG